MANIKDGQRLLGASQGAYRVPIYDAGFGPVWVLRDSLGIRGVVRAPCWEDAYSICEDEFFPEALETTDELEAEYGFRREHLKIVQDGENREREARYPDDYPHGRLDPNLLFVRWETRETPDPRAWPDNEIFQENYGFRPNGPNSTDVLMHGVYQKDLNGESLDPLTDADKIRLVIEEEDGSLAST